MGELTVMTGGGGKGWDPGGLGLGYGEAWEVARGGPDQREVWEDLGQHTGAGGRPIRGRHRRWEPGGGRTGLHGESFFPGHGGAEMGVKFSGEEGMTHLLEPNPRGEREDFYAILHTESGEKETWRGPPYRSIGGGMGDASSAWGGVDSTVRKVRRSTLEKEGWRELQYRDQGGEWGRSEGGHRVKKQIIPLLEGEPPRRGNLTPPYGGEGPGPPGDTFQHRSWGESAEENTWTLEITMTSAPAVAHPDYTQQLKRQSNLLEHQFIVQTNQRSVEYLLEQRWVAEKHQELQDMLLGYDCKIHYNPRIQNKAAGVLSKVGYSQPLALAVLQLINWADQIRKSQQGKKRERIRTVIQKREVGSKGYHLENSLVIYKGRMVQQGTSSNNHILLQENHDDSVAEQRGRSQLNSLVLARQETVHDWELAPRERNSRKRSRFFLPQCTKDEAISEDKAWKQTGIRKKKGVWTRLEPSDERPSLDGEIHQSTKLIGRSRKEARNSSSFNLEDKVGFKGAVLLYP